MQAYTTLIDPITREIYDTEGIKGLTKHNMAEEGSKLIYQLDFFNVF